MIDIKLLIKNAVHFGHQTSRWCPKMKIYIWGFKNNIHLIDVSKTAAQLEQASKFLEDAAADGKVILLVGTKKAAQNTITKIANELNLPYVAHRWIGGTFSNYRQVKKSVSNLMHFEDILSKSKELHYSKKELNTIQKRSERLEKNVGGIRNLTWPVGAVVIVDVKKEDIAVKEAQKMGIPIVAIVDTNSDPSGIDHVIPGNDDAPRAIEILLDYLSKAIKRGQEKAASKPKEEIEETIGYETTYEPTEPEEDDEKTPRGKKRMRPTQPIKQIKKVTKVKITTEPEETKVNAAKQELKSEDQNKEETLKPSKETSQDKK